MKKSFILLVRASFSEQLFEKNEDEEAHFAKLPLEAYSNIGECWYFLRHLLGYITRQIQLTEDVLRERLERVRANNANVVMYIENNN